MADTAATAESAVYIIQLSDAPLASYRGGVEGLSATSPSALGQRKLDMNSAASRAYLDHLQSVQDAFVAGVASTLGRSVDVRYYYQVAFNGVAITMSPAEAAQVAALDGVQMIVRETFEMPLTDTGPTFIGAPGIWNGTATGGMGGTYGEGVIAGIIDSGINVVDNHPSFWEVGGDGYIHTNPLADYVGVCAGGNTDPDLTCNDKMIGYRGYNGETPGDSDGHGSHTASTVAGNFTQGSIAATIPVTLDISGVAPHANIISYDACVTSCPSAGLLAAVNDATADGVDVINYSISGGSNPYGDPVEQAFLSARDAGVFVSASAGNNGPGAGTVAHVSPWLTTVAASTHSRTWVNQLTNMSGGTTPPADMTGRSISAGYGPAPIVHAGDFGDPLCGTPFPAGTWTGQIVVCDRGTFGRVEKGVNVLAGGAGGYVLANGAANGESINADAHALPAIHLGYADSQVLLTWLASGSGHTATITEGTYTLDPALGDIMAGFSSRGPVGSLPDLVKPDVTAPGVDIFAAYADPVDFEFLSGTSMSSPHNAGAGALLTALHPDWTPAEIQSALMTTALTDVVKEDGVTPADPFDIGAGRVNLLQAGMAGLVMDETLANYVAANPSLGGDPRTLNTPSMGDNDCGGACSWTRTFRNTMDFTAVYNVSLDLPAGVTGTVNPTQLVINAGGTGTVTVDLDVSGAPVGSWMFAQLNLEPVPVEGLTGGPVQVCSTTPLPIPDNLPAGATSTINPGVSATVLDANVIINATHTWVGDMIFTVEHNGTSVTVYDRPGLPASTFGCSGDNVAATLDDSAATPVEDECGAVPPVINGSFIPNNPLSVFNGMDVNGDWTITASDNAGGDTGTLDQWCMEVTLDGSGGGGVPAQHLPIAFIPTSSVSNIIVTPSSLANTQPTNTTAVLPLNIANTGGATLDWNIFEDGGGTSPQGLWSDNFDSYANGTNLHGVNGWKGWGNDPNAAAVVTNAASLSAPNSVDINGPSDLVHEYSGANSGTWAYTAYQYVPGNMTGVSYFILLNQYDDAGATNNWSTQVQFDGVNNIVLSDPDGATLPLIRDRWVEIRVEIDLITDSQTFFYDNTILYTKSWTDGNSGGGILNIGAVDLFANGATTVYYDDMSLSQTGGGTCSAPVDIPWASVNPTAGSISAGGNSDVDVTLDSTGLAAGTYSGNLCVESNDPDTPLVVVPVDLTVEAGGGDPDIEVAPSSLTATQAPDTTTMQTLAISNVGSADLDWMISEETAVAFNGPFVNNPLSASEEVGSAGAGSSNPAPLSDFEWPEVVLWDNGPLVTHPGGGAGGADESRLQNSSLLMTTLGFGHQVLNNNWVADDFVVSDAGGWTVDAATFFAYQTGSTTTSTMTNVNWILYDGDPSSGGMMITSGSGLQASVWSNIYRATETTIGATDRPIMATTVNMGGLFLPAGTYWLAWQTDGTLASGPWAPPITIVGQTTTGNGLQSLAGTTTFAPANDGGTLTQQGFPFILEGSVGGGGGGGCDAPSDIPWLSLNPTAGSTAAGGTTTVDVTYDSTGYAAGTYTGLLCVNSNDPDTPLVEVPVEMIVEGGGTNPAIVMTKTVGTTAGVCATTDNITVSSGTQVYYCYVAENIGDVTFNFHDLVDSELGTILDNFNFVLPPGGVSPEVIVPAVINVPTVNTGTWTAVTSIGGYTYDDTINYNFEDIAATGTAFILGDDEVSGPLPIGFSFDFYGVTYTDIRASSNGFLTVNNDTNSGCCTGQPLPTPGSPDGLIAGWWEDFDPAEAGSGLYYQTLGTAPNRYMIVQYTNVQHYPSGTPVTLQYKLYEGSNVIEVHYLDAPSDGGTHSAGLENQDGTVGIQYFLGTTGLPALSAVRYTPELAQSASASDTATVQIADPDIVVDPTSLASTQEPDTQVTLPLDISNVGTADLTWTIDEAAPALPVSVSAPVVTGGQTVTIGDGVISRHPDAKPGVPNSATPVVERPAGLTTITHSVSQTIIQFNSVSCNAGGLHTDNSYLRYFTLSDFGITADFEVVEVEIGIETATGATGTQPATMRLYTWDPNTPFIFANLTPIGSANVTVSDQALTVLTVPVSGVVPAGGTLVVEFFTPNGQTAGDSLFVGSNNLGQTAPTYLAAADCGVLEPTDTGSIGFPDMHLVMNVTGQSTGPCSAPSDIPWLSLNPTAGTTAPGGTTTVDVTFDSTGYATGTYTGTLCVNSNDPDTPLVEVPVEMTVQGEVPVASIALTKTVGLDPNICATTSNLVVGQPSTVVYYCYTVTNTGNVTLTVHDLQDDQLGTIFTGFAYDLAPGASVDTVAAGLTISTTVTGTVTNVGTWTAYVPGGPSATATATATVTEQPTDVSLSGFGGEAHLALQPVLLAALLILTLGLAALWRRKAAEG